MGIVRSFFFGFLAACAWTDSPAGAAITIRCVPDDAVVPGGALVTVTCTIESTEDVNLRGVQVDLPCALPGANANSSGTVLTAGISVDRGHKSPPFLFNVGQDQGLAVVNTRECRASVAPPLGVPSVLLPAGAPRYLATARYRVSLCARSAFNLRLEDFVNPPTEMDSTYVVDENNNRLVFAAPVSQISATADCPCETDEECDDDNLCTTDDCTGGICKNDRNDAECDDGLFCTGLDECRNGLCYGPPHPVGQACEGSLICDEVTDRCLDCRFDTDCETLNCRTPTCGKLGICEYVDTVGPCDDGLFCTVTDSCENGECVGTDSPCGANQVCDEDSETCRGICPDGTLLDSEPGHGLIDARQPHPPDSAAFADRMGVGSEGEPIQLTLNALQAPPDCFTLFETEVEKGFSANAIANMTETSPGEYRIFLQRPITTGAVTRISYFDRSFVAFTSHPANVNADAAADSDDVVSLLAYLMDDPDERPPYRIYSLDIDHSNEAGLGDVLRTIDLLLGAGLYDPWDGTPRPE